MPRYIGPFHVLHRQGNAYTIELPRRMRTRPTFYVGLLRPYYQYEAFSENGYNRHAQEPPADSCNHGPNSRVGPSATPFREELPPARRAGDETYARSQFKRTRIPIGSSYDRTHQSHGRHQVVPTIVFVLHVLPQLGQVTFVVT